MRRPNSGRWSNQAISSRRTTVHPMTMITGGEMPAASISSASVPSVAITVRWRGCVPHSIAAAGISSGMPAPISAAAIRGIVLTAMYSTSVPPLCASAAQLVIWAVLSGSSWPVTKVTEVESPRCVTGIPA
jgi:hypothetical protein